jgi:hypothetical protein
MSYRARDLILSSLGEGIKTKSVYDGSDRLIEFYEAPASSFDGDPCLITYYQYVGATSLVDATKEVVGQWDATWDF